MKKNKTCLFLFLIICFQFLSSQTVYETDLLKIEKLNKNVFQHISYLKTQDFGKVACNGMVYFSQEEAIVFDTPVNNEASKELIHWVKNTNNKRIVALVGTHYHNDCVAGIQAFHNNKIPSYASNLTIELIMKEGETPPLNSFKSKKKIKVGSSIVLLKYFGEGHTKDNVVGYIKQEHTLFGGCLIKSVGAGKGYLGDANVKEWSNTVLKIKKTFPDLVLVIPGHGKSGNTELLDYTIKLFKGE